MHQSNKIRTFYSNTPNYKFLKEAVNVLESAGMIIFPTDTVYAIGCLSNQSERLKDLAKIKGVKLEHAPLSFIFEDIRDLSEFVSPMNSKVFRLIKRILPGPYALIMQSANKLPKPFQKRRSIGVRIPNHPILMKLLPLLSAPLVSTSIHDTWINSKFLNMKSFSYSSHIITLFYNILIKTHTVFIISAVGHF